MFNQSATMTQPASQLETTSLWIPVLPYAQLHAFKPPPPPPSLLQTVKAVGDLTLIKKYPPPQFALGKLLPRVSDIFTF